MRTVEVMRSWIKTLLKRYPEEDDYKRNSKFQVNYNGHDEKIREKKYHYFTKAS
jgi:hypothetical protein